MADRELAELLRRGDADRWRAAATKRLSRVLRFLNRRLYGDDRMRAVRALGWLAADPATTPEPALVELMRRFLWALNDESGAVPFGIPEAIGEIVAQRSELRAVYLPILCSMLTAETMLQTGDIERGVIWAIGRVGPVAAEQCPEAAAALAEIARAHADGETRAAASAALSAIGVEAGPARRSPSGRG